MKLTNGIDEQYACRMLGATLPVVGGKVTEDVDGVDGAIPVQVRVGVVGGIAEAAAVGGRQVAKMSMGSTTQLPSTSPVMVTTTQPLIKPLSMRAREYD